MITDLSSLNPEQKAAVTSEAKQILCLAGAGTGKTQCMIHKIQYLVQDQNVDQSSILALTFTNAAAFEMKERFKRLTNLKKCPEFRTFHAFCYSLLGIDKEVRAAIGYARCPRIIEDDEFAKYVEIAKTQSGCKLSKNQISNHDHLSPKDKDSYNSLKECLYRLLKKEGVITFDLLIKSVSALFAKDYDCIKKYKEKYKYIFVDEFQDTDPRQFKFVMSFENANKFVIGDALQSIYGFRNADSSIIKGLASNDEWTTFKLYRNYRSTKQICEYANKFSKYANKSYRIEINSDHDGANVIELGAPAFNKGTVDENTLNNIAYRLQSLTGKSAILARTNKEANRVKGFLSELGVDLVDQEGIQTAIHMMKSVLDDDYCLNWNASLLSSSMYSQFIYSSESTPNYTVADLMQQFKKDYNLSNRMYLIMKIREMFSSGSLDRRGISYLNTCFHLGTFKSSVHDEITTLYSYVEYLEKLLTDDSAQARNIYVGTIHSSKGLEYDNVFLVNVGSSSFILDNEEQKNLAYVGITRAKNNLILYKGGC